MQVPARDHPEPQVPIDYRIIYRDDWLVAVDKGPGAPVHPSRSFRTRTVLTRLKAELGSADLRPAHRLDRETSGVLLFCHTAAVVSATMQQFALGAVRKRYLAIVRGVPEFDRLRVELPLGSDTAFPIRCRMRVDRISGRRAETTFETLARLENRALVSAVPATGRQHQIRVHLAELGFPVLGDKLYQENGRPYLAMIHDALDADCASRLGHSRQALHAERLELTHPVTGEPLLLTAPLPSDLQKLLH